MRKIRMTRSIAILGVLAAAVLGVVGTASVGQTDTEGNRLAHATVRDVNGTVLGTVNFFSDRGKLTVTGRLHGLSAGFHGMHVHAVGICDPQATDPAGNVVPFVSAGGHLGATTTGHGNHAGDLPLLLVSADGTTTTVTATDRLNRALLFDTDGSALIVHALADNYANIPTRYSATGPDAATLATGDSGGRVGCGLVSRG